MSPACGRPADHLSTPRLPTSTYDVTLRGARRRPLILGTRKGGGGGAPRREDQGTRGAWPRRAAARLRATTSQDRHRPRRWHGGWRERCMHHQRDVDLRRRQRQESASARRPRGCATSIKSNSDELVERDMPGSIMKVPPLMSSHQAPSQQVGRPPPGDAARCAGRRTRSQGRGPVGAATAVPTSHSASRWIFVPEQHRVTAQDSDERIGRRTRVEKMTHSSGLTSPWRGGGSCSAKCGLGHVDEHRSWKQVPPTPR